jgi:chromosome partitioning protein
MRRIAIINQKGGVGKTTTVANLGAALARAGRRVAVIDLDPQANLSLHVDVPAEQGEASLYTVLIGETPFAAALRPTRTPGLSIVSSNIDLSGAELELASAIGRESLLRDALDAWEREARDRDARPPADYLLIDCPPSLGLLSINGLVAASETIVTLQTEFFALQGMSKLVEVLKLLQKRLNPGLRIAGILPCMYDSRLKLAREVLAEIKNYFPGQVFTRAIGKNVKLAEAPSYGRTIFEYAPECSGASDYDALAVELLQQEARDPDLAALPRPAAVGVTAPEERLAEKIVVPAKPRTPRAPKPAPVVVTPSPEPLRSVEIVPAAPPASAATPAAPNGRAHDDETATAEPAVAATALLESRLETVALAADEPAAESAPVAVALSTAALDDSTLPALRTGELDDLPDLPGEALLLESDAPNGA